jgi:hypothetical protein
LPNPPAPPPQPTAFRPFVQKLLDFGTIGTSLLGHVVVAALVVGFNVVTLDLDGPGAEDGATEGPVGNGGGDAGGDDSLKTPPVPVRVSVYQPSAPKPKDAEPTPRTEPTKSKPEPTDNTASTNTESSPEGTGDASKEGVEGNAPRGTRKPCEPAEEIVQVGETRWRVKRSIIDWYAVHIRELEKQAGVGIHRSEDGKRDGARLYLPRCSILRQAGFRGGDIVHSVNGHKVSTIAAGVKTYAKVRNDRVLNVEITRKNGTKVTLTYKLVQ